MGSSVRRVSRHRGCSVLSTNVLSGDGAQTALSSALSLGDGSTGFTVVVDAFISSNIVNSAIICGVYGTVFDDGVVLYRNGDNIVAQVKAAGVALQLNDLRSGWRQIVFSCDGATRIGTMYVDGVYFTQTGAWAAAAFPATMRAYVGDGPGVGVGGGGASDMIVDVGHAWSSAQALEYWRSGKYPQATRRWPLDDGYGAAREVLVGDLPMALQGGAVWSPASPGKATSAAQNYMVRGDDVSASPWAVSADATTTPHGTFGNGAPAVTLLDTAANSLHYSVQSMPAGIVAGDEVIVSAIARRVAGSGWFAIEVGTVICYFNLNTGDIGSFSFGVSPGVDRVRNASMAVVPGEFRVWYRYRWDGSNPNVYAFTALLDSTPSYAGPSEQVDVGAVMLEKCVPGQTSPGPITVPYFPGVYGPDGMNLILYSEDPSNAVYAKTGCTPNSAGDLIEDNTAGRHRFYQGSLPGFVANRAFTVSARVTVGARRYVSFTVNDAAAEMAWFDTQGAGAVAYTGAGVTASIARVSAGVFDCSMTVTAGDASASASVSVGADVAFNGSGDYQGVNGTVAMTFNRLWVTQGVVRATYVKTLGSAVDLRSARFSVYGQRDIQQNLAKSSEDASSAVYTSATGFAVTAGLPGVMGPTSATRLTVTNAVAYRYQDYTGEPSIVGDPYCGSMWLWTDTPGKRVGLRMASLPAGSPLEIKQIVLTTTPTRYSVVGVVTAPAEQGGITLGVDNRLAAGGDDGATGTVFVDGVQLEKSNLPGDYTPTFNSVHNPSGAPRRTT